MNQTKHHPSTHVGPFKIPTLRLVPEFKVRIPHDWNKRAWQFDSLQNHFYRIDVPPPFIVTPSFDGCACDGASTVTFRLALPKGESPPSPLGAITLHDDGACDC